MAYTTASEISKIVNVQCLLELYMLLAPYSHVALCELLVRKYNQQYLYDFPKLYSFKV